MKSISQLVPTSARAAIARVVFYGKKRYCPICGYSFRAFRRAGLVPRPDAQCPVCRSRERHRLYWRYLQEKTSFFELSGVKMLHLAAEPCFEPRFRRQLGEGYLTADLLFPADVKMDITDIQFPDNTFDIIYCSHVLDQVPDDRRAMRELYRVLKPGGWATMLVPIKVDATFEDASITDPAERLRVFGNPDYARCYGPDFKDRLEEAGFSVLPIKAADFLSPEELERIAVPPAMDTIFHCTKSAE